MIYTSYFSKLKKIDTNKYYPVAISTSVPMWISNYRKYTKLAPSWDILDEYKKEGNEKLYRERYRNEILSKLDPQKVLEELSNIEVSLNKEIVLMCYEASDKFCHRHLVVEWLKENTTIEYGGEL